MESDKEWFQLLAGNSLRASMDHMHSTMAKTQSAMNEIVKKVFQEKESAIKDRFESVLVETQSAMVSAMDDKITEAVTKIDQAVMKIDVRSQLTDVLKRDIVHVDFDPKRTEHQIQTELMAKDENINTIDIEPQVNKDKSKIGLRSQITQAITQIDLRPQ